MADLGIVWYQSIIHGTGELQHFPTLMNGGFGHGAVARSARQHKPNLSKRQKVADHPATVNMAAVDRIKSTAK